MSQQINLLLPELRPRHDPLALSTVLAAAFLGLAVAGGYGGYARHQADALTQEKLRLERDLAAARERVRVLGQTLAARKPDPVLLQQVEAMQALARRREELLHVVESGQAGSYAGFSGVLGGFARQTLEGVWLVGFALKGDDIEIRGRLTDHALLPAYIRKLETDAAFQGRRLAALDMKGVQPAAGTGGGESGGGAAPAGRFAGPQRYTEFFLRSRLEAEPKQEKQE